MQASLGRAEIFPSILATIGSTPVVRIQRLAPPHVQMYVKIESFNPSGSIKDRMAVAVLIDAKRRGVLQPGQAVVEATSGNTGIAMAMVCAALGHPFLAFISDKSTVERQKLIRAYGGKVILTPAAAGASGRVDAAEEYAQRNGAFLARQYENPANPQSHRDTTGAEILTAFANTPLHWLVCGWGTGGTLTGAAEALKAGRPQVRIVAAEPSRAAVLQGAQWAPHGIPGWTPNFMPRTFNRDLVDQAVSVSDDEARKWASALARTEGILCGISSGGSFAAALTVAKKYALAGDTILAVLPDTGERYLSTLECECEHVAGCKCATS
jgi:cysteine synthase